MSADYFVHWKAGTRAPTFSTLRKIAANYLNFSEESLPRLSPQENLTYFKSKQGIFRLPGQPSDPFRRQPEILGQRYRDRSEIYRDSRWVELWVNPGRSSVDCLTRSQDPFTNDITLGLTRVYAAAFRAAPDSEVRSALKETFHLRSPFLRPPDLSVATFAAPSFLQLARLVEDYVGEKKWVHRHRGDGGRGTRAISIELPGTPRCALEQAKRAPGYDRVAVKKLANSRLISLVWKENGKQVFVDAKDQDQLTNSVAFGFAASAARFFNCTK